MPGQSVGLLIAVMILIFAGNSFAGGILKFSNLTIQKSSSAVPSVATTDLLLPTQPSTSNASAQSSSILVTDEMFSTGSYIINMGITPQTVANGMKPYGLIYQLLSVYSVPVSWVINPLKVKDGIDFSHNGIDYKGGPFIIPAEFRTASVNSLITTWEGMGVVGATTVSPITVPVYTTLTFAPNWTLDLQNGTIADDWLIAAGIPNTAWTISYPVDLDACDDIFVLPHADPTWANHGHLLDWNLTDRGAIWGGCHGAGALELMFNPADHTQQTNFLSEKTGTALGAGPYANPENSVIKWTNHADGSIPYNNAYPTDPIMQFMGTTDAAHQNGSEQIYLPVVGGSWRATTKIGVWDPTQTDVTNGDSPGPAAVILYGRGFGDDNRGLILHEGGHDIFSGTGPANVAAVRAFFNFSFLAGKDKATSLECASIPSSAPGGMPFPVSVVASPAGTYTYEWSSPCGTFGNASAASTTFTPTVVQVNTTCVISVRVTDACGRISFCSQSFTIECSLPAFSVTAMPSSICAGQTSTLSISGLASTFTHGFSSSGGAISIIDNANAVPFPKTISVSGLPTSGVTVKNIQFTSLTHPEPADMDIYLVGPNAQTIWLTSDAGGSATISNFNLTFQDGGTAISTSAFVNNGTYAPGNLGGGDAVPPPTVITTLAGFTGNMNGNWSLYIIDDTNTDGDGSMASFTVNFNEPYTYLWSNGPTTPTQMVNPLVTTLYTVTVSAGTTCTGTGMVTVSVDNTPPTIMCPMDLSVQCANQVPAANPASATASDNIPGNATVTFVGDVISNQTCPNRFTVTRTYRATDACGNSATCNQTINVFDNTAPPITCPPNTTVQCANQVPNPNGPTIGATDNCGGNATVTFVADVISNQTCANRFVVTRTYQAADECGNTSTCNQIITVLDNTAPPITCPTNVTVQCANQVPSPNGPTAGATDNCGGVSTVSFVGDVISNQTCANRFTVTRTYRALDECGNSATCNQIITVFDNTAPPITCPSNVTVQCANQVPTPNGPTAGATDNCGGTSTVTFLADVISNQTCANRYTVTRTYKASDECGNTATCNQIIVVFDDTAPPITCPSDLTVQCANQVPTPNGPTPGATDNCGGVSTVSFVADVISNQTCANRYVVTRTYRAVDVCGNSATCNQIITVFDNTAPPITCPSNLTVQCANQVPTPNGPTAGATDNCGGVATVSFVADVISNQTCTNRYTVTRTYRAMDECGNSATCNQIITVFDNTAPPINCPANTTVQCANLVPMPNAPAPGLGDNCGGISTVSFVGDVISNQTCANRYIVTRTYRAIDECGNSATCNQTITVFDNTGPSITCPENVSVQCASNVPPANTEGIMTSDNCGGTATVAFVGDVVSNQTCPNRYTVTRTYRATDVCGNSSTCNQTITVYDNTPPSCMTQNITISIDQQAGHTDITAAMIDNGSSDNCGSVTLGVSPSTFTCMNVGVNIVTLTVTDQCNNTSTCTATVTVNSCFNPCVTVVSCVYLQGAAVNPNGSDTYSLPMRTTLNNLRVLPGQTYLDPFFGTPHYTPAGEPYCAPPWNYCGTEGAGFNTFGVPGNAGYPPTVVDWVLVSIRADSSGNGGPLCQAAALLHNDGHLEFVQPFNCCDLNFALSYYLVIEHRNHLIVMSHQKVPIVPGIVQSTLTYSFCAQQSYEDPNFAGFFARQKEIIPGSFAMFTGNGDQTTSNNADTDINAGDLSTWQSQNGTFGAYRLGDYNLNGDTNLNDRVAWERNNGTTTSVPRLP